MPSSELKDAVVEHLTGGRCDAAVECIRAADAAKLRDAAWELVPAICTYVHADQNDVYPTMVARCQEALSHIVSVGNVKELLIILLEQMDQYNDDIKYKVLLHVIGECLRGLPSGKRLHSVMLSLETCYGQVSALELPDDLALEGKEKVCLELDDAVVRAADITLTFLTFMEPLTPELAWRSTEQAALERNKKHSMELCKYLIKVLDHPLAYLDLTYNPPAPRTTSRLCAEKVVSLMGEIQPNFVQTVLNLISEMEAAQRRSAETELKKKQAENSGEDFDALDHFNVGDKVSMLGIATFCYLAFTGDIPHGSMPHIYTSQYLLELNCYFITNLLNRKENLVIHKGLELLSALESNVEEKTFNSQILEACEVKDLVHVLIKVMTTAKVKELSQTSVKLLRNLLKKFNIPGRHHFLHYLLHAVKHSGLTGYVITLIKDEIDDTLKQNPPNKDFTGAKLWKLLKLVFMLPTGEKTDLLENVDRIMGALNLLRYLIIRDKHSENITGLWDHVTVIQNSYLELLRKGLNMSRAHYELELKQTKERGRKKRPQIEFSMEGEGPGGSSMGMDVGQEIQALEMAIHTFDMMESIVGRITELFEHNHKDTPGTEPHEEQADKS